jgi:hypothetical protein
MVGGPEKAATGCVLAKEQGKRLKLSVDIAKTARIDSSSSDKALKATSTKEFWPIVEKILGSIGFKHKRLPQTAPTPGL